MVTGVVSVSVAAAVAGTVQAPARAMAAETRISDSKIYQTTEEDFAESVIASFAAQRAEKLFAQERVDILHSVVAPTTMKTQTNNVGVAASTDAQQYVNVYKEGSTDSEVVGKMSTNDVAQILGMDVAGWTKIMSGEVVGYVPTANLVDGAAGKALSTMVKTSVAVVNDEDTKVYKSTTDRSETVEESGKGDSYKVVSADSEGWTKVETESGTGYVRTDAVSVETTTPVAETAQENEERTKDQSTKDVADETRETAAMAQAVAAQAQSLVQNSDDDASASVAAVIALAAQANAQGAQQVADTAQEAYDNDAAAKGQAVADFACQFVGNPYVWGGTSLTNGCDCSGFTMSVYKNFDYSLPHFAASQEAYGERVDSLADARPGDLICFGDHIGIYIGDGMMVHAANARDGIKISKADYRRYRTIRRIFA